MKLVIFGLTISSSWGNGHATIWRGLCRALGRMGHRVVFFERDVPYYASTRDTSRPEGCDLRLYGDFAAIRGAAREELAGADVGMVTSYCPDAIEATDLVLSSAPTSVFYDLDAPVTLARLAAGEPVGYLGASGLAGFDLVLSFTGGAALGALAGRLGARRVVPLYGAVDPEVHRPVARPDHRTDLSYLGTYAADRDAALRSLLLEPAQRAPARRFVVGGSLYPAGFSWPANVRHVEHVAPADHPAFFASARLTLNVTRGAMAALGHCPSGRLFEAAASGVPVVSDVWAGIDAFFEPGREILLARSPDDVVAALSLSDAELDVIAATARERVLAEHTAGRRAVELVAALEAQTRGR